jgi:hypothetical protein
MTPEHLDEHHPSIRNLLLVTEQRRQRAKNLGMSQLLHAIAHPPRTCLGCGATTNEHGELPCGH